MGSNLRAGLSRAADTPLIEVLLELGLTRILVVNNETTTTSDAPTRHQ